MSWRSMAEREILLNLQVHNFFSLPTEAATDPPKTSDSEPLFTKLRNPSTGKFWNWHELVKVLVDSLHHQKIHILQTEIMMIV